MYPEDLRYSKEHEWIRVEGGMAISGISSYAQDQLGDVVYVEMPEVGAEVEQMVPFGVVESVKAVSDLYSPLSGEVVAVNEELYTRPELVNEDPYGEGWMVRIRPSDLEGELEKLLDADQYQQWVRSLEEE
jgi:glycine cleavage system H protein